MNGLVAGWSRLYKGPAMVESSPGEKASIVAGIDPVDPCNPQKSHATVPWKLAYIEGEVLKYCLASASSKKDATSNSQRKIPSHDSAGWQAVILGYIW